MLDSNVSTRVVDGRLMAASFEGGKLIVVAVQAAELRRCPDPTRQAALVVAILPAAPVTVLAASFMFDVDGAGFGQAG